VAEARKFGLERVVHPSQSVTTLRQALAVLSRGAEEAAQAA
jgi:hypothetical protein